MAVVGITEKQVRQFCAGLLIQITCSHTLNIRKVWGMTIRPENHEIQRGSAYEFGWLMTREEDYEFKNNIRCFCSLNFEREAGLFPIVRHRVEG